MPPPLADIHALIALLRKTAIDAEEDPKWYRFKLDAVAVKLRWNLDHAIKVAEFADAMEYVTYSAPQFSDYPPTVVLTENGIAKAKDNAIHEKLMAPEKPKRTRRPMKAPATAAQVPATPTIPSMLDVIEGPPSDWQGLQDRAAAILRECGFEAETDVRVTHVRGTSDLDVRAVDKSPPSRLLICECKRWGKAVSKTTVHAFQMVVANTGADTGYVISSKGFQTGAFEAARSSNVKLVTWEEFQREFVDRWVERYFIPTLMKRVAKLVGYGDPMPRTPDSMSIEGFKVWEKTHERELPVGWLVGGLWGITHHMPGAFREQFFEHVEQWRTKLPPEFFAQPTLRDVFDYIVDVNDRMVVSTDALARKYPRT